MNPNPYELIQIDESSWRIEDNGVRAFLFIGSDKALLIDSGFGSNNILDAIRSITSLPISLVITHADRDHIGCNHLFDNALLHPSEFALYNHNSALPLWEGDSIDLGNRLFDVILIPGHTPGSIALLDKNNRILISGDSVQAGAIFMFGPHRNIDAYISSMFKLQKLSHLFDSVYPSHGPFPVDKSIIPLLIDGASRIRDGSLTGSPDPRFGDNVSSFDAGAATFLFSPPSSTDSHL